VAPYVVQAIRRYVLGPDSTDTRIPRRLDLPGDAPTQQRQDTPTGQEQPAVNPTETH